MYELVEKLYFAAAVTATKRPKWRHGSIPYTQEKGINEIAQKETKFNKTRLKSSKKCKRYRKKSIILIKSRKVQNSDKTDCQNVVTMATSYLKKKEERPVVPNCCTCLESVMNVQSPRGQIPLTSSLCLRIKPLITDALYALAGSSRHLNVMAGGATQ